MSIVPAATQAGTQVLDMGVTLSLTLKEQVDFEKMSRHRIQWLLACNLLSYFVCTFKNVAEGQRMQIWVGLYSHYNASLPG